MAKVSVRIDIAVGEADAAEVESATSQLREELLLLDVDSVEVPRGGQPPTTAKAGADLVIIGALLLTTSGSVPLSAVVEVIKSWIGRSTERTARLEIDGDVLDVRGLSSFDQKLLINQWISHHNGLDNEV